MPTPRVPAQALPPPGGMASSPTLSWVLCAAILLLAWSALGALALNDVRASREQHAEFARVSAKGFAHYANQHLQQVDALLMDLRVRVATGRALTGEMAVDAAAMPLLRQVAVSDGEGRLVAGSLSPTTGPGASIAQRPFFMALRQNPADRTYVSAPAPGQPPQTLALLLARPRVDASGAFMGVVVAATEPTRLREYFGPHNALPADAVVLLVGKDDGVVRLRFGAGGVSWGQSMLDDPAWNDVADQVHGTYASPADATGHFLAGAFQQVGDLPLAAAIAFREEPWWKAAAPRLGIAAAAALAFSVLLVSLTAVRVRRQVRRLRRQQAQRDEQARRRDGRDSTSMVNTLLGLARAEATREPLQSEAVDLGALLAAVVNVQSEAAAHTGVPMTLAMDLPAGHQVVAQTDRRKLSQAIDNVLHNSVQCTQEGAIWVTARLDGSDFIVRVVDTGQGLPAASCAGDALHGDSPHGTRDATHGPGLGLALSRELMLLLGGSITLTMEPGEGTQVELRLPQAQLELLAADPG